MSLPALEYLQECFNYNPTDGLFVWKQRPAHHFESEHAMKTINVRQAGKPAGSKPTKGCQSHVRLLGKYYSVKKVIWKLMTGTEPDRHLTFKDGCTNNLKFDNIIPKTVSPNITVGLKWVSQVNNRFVAKVSYKTKCYYVGIFDTAEQAHEAGRMKKEELINAYA